MTDRRRHRGAHPKDTELFSQAALPALRSAVAHLSNLLIRGDPLRASLALVGDRGLHWTVEVVPDPDRVLAAAPADVLVASADSQIMNGAPRTWQLARETVEGMRPKPWIVDLASSDGSIAP